MTIESCLVVGGRAEHVLFQETKREAVIAAKRLYSGLFDVSWDSRAVCEWAAKRLKSGAMSLGEIE
jgi:hypothetical protein